TGRALGVYSVQTSNRKAPAAGRKRRGKALYLTIGALGVASCIALAALFLMRRGKATEYEEYVTATVWKGPYDFAVIEQGLLESASNNEIRCQVLSRGRGVSIIDDI